MKVGGAKEEPMKKPVRKLLFDPPAEAYVQDIVEMDWREFDKAETNPMQRDTEAHARGATHLLHWDPRHREVELSILPDGRVIKNDGHTRCYMWRTGMAPEPPVPLQVTRRRVADEEMAGKEKLKIDNRHATNQPHHVLYGALRSLEVEFKSKVLGDRRFLGAIRVAENFLNPGHEDIVDDLQPAVSRWLRELRLFDSVMPTRKRFNTSLQAASLLIIRHWGDAVLPFLQAHQDERADQHGTKLSAQASFSKRYEKLRADAAKHWSRARDQEMVRLAVSAYIAVEADRWFEVGVSGLSILPEPQFQKWLAKTRAMSNGLSQRLTALEKSK